MNQWRVYEVTCWSNLSNIAPVERQDQEKPGAEIISEITCRIEQFIGREYNGI